MKKVKQKTGDSTPSDRYPPSINAGHPDVRRFPERWPRKTFQDVLEPAMRPIVLADDQEYQLIVAKRNRGGIAPRERLLGRQVLTSGQYMIRTGDFVIAKRQISHGACGFVPAYLDGAIVSGEYDVFRVKKGLLPGFLEIITHTPYFQQTCFHSSIGVALEKLIFKTDKWLKFEMPVPSVEEQKKVVAAVEAVERYAASVEKLLAAKRKFKVGVMGELLSGRTAKDASKTMRLDEVAVVGFSGVDKKSEDGEIAVRLCNYVDVLRNHEITDKIDFMPATASAHEIARFAIQKNDIILTKDSETREDIANLARVACPLKGVVCGYHLAHIRPLPDKIDPLYLSYWLESWHARKHFVQWATGAGVRYGLPLGAMEEAPVWTPSRARQESTAKTLQLIDREITNLESIATQTRLYKRGLMQRLLSPKD